MSDLVQQAIADIVAEGVVDAFEAIQIYVEQAQRFVVARRARDRGIEAFVEQLAVGQVGRASCRERV